MQPEARHLVDLENRFWKSIVEKDTQSAVAILNEPALMISSHGAFKFDHAGYAKMADKGTMILQSYELGDIDVVFATDDVAVLTYKVKQIVAMRDKEATTTQNMQDSSTWVRKGGDWRCLMHTEAPVAN